MSLRCRLPSAPLLGLVLLVPPTTICGQLTQEDLGLEISFHDASPRFSGGQYLAGWANRDLATIDAPREGTSTDGVSRLLVRIEAPGPGRVEVELVTPGAQNGALRMMGDPYALDVDGRYLAFALYTPPEHFGPRSGRDGLWHGEVDFRGVGIRVRFEGNNGLELEGASAIILTRPPLVLVHGTFDNPVAAWQTPSDLGPAPVDAFRAAGFRPFTVDYSGTSAAPASARTYEGGRLTRSWLNPGESSFQANRRVVLENPGGIRHALAYYRDTLGIAAVQADVVGHSLGGTLGRVLASETYNPDYRNPENYNQGWINRLVTISTPHHGSDLPAALGFFEEAQEMENRSWMEWFVAWSIPLAAWWEGRSAAAANAVRDQLPRSEALRAIGATEVPAHAVIGHMDISRLKDDTPTELLFTGIAAVFYYFPGLLNDFINALVQEWAGLPPNQRMATTVDGSPPPFPIASPEAYEDFLRQQVMEAMNVESEFWLSRRDEDWLMTVRGLRNRPQIPPGFLDTGFGEDPEEYGILDQIAEGVAATGQLGVALQRPDTLTGHLVPYPLVDLFRDLIFRNDMNDGTVRLQSQSGGLDSRYLTRIETPVVHSISPRYPEVQQAVLEVLEAGGEKFAPGGFPRAGQLLPTWLPSRSLETHYREGLEAICWSGMVWDHAQAYAAVADSAQAVVMVRPVNPDATPLIARNMATKGMAVKGKSSNWGPQVGFIAQHQRFSKIWRNLRGPSRDAAVKKYDSLVVEVVEDSLAVLRDLRLTFDDQPGNVYTVYEDPSVTDAEQAIHLVRSQGDDLQACDWRTGGTGFSRDRGPSDCRSIESTGGWEPLRVLADPGELDPAGNPRYLTADYDLLAMGFRDRSLPVPYLLHSFLPNHFPDQRGERTIPAMVLPRRDGRADTLRFDPVEGFITEEQSALVRALNRKVAETGYVAGRVTHHGPENHYGGSPYVDYPITVFEPSRNGPGRVLSIPMGPAGFRDVHLKRYLVQKRQEGFNLLPNPSARGWQWDNWGEYSAITGWDPRDAPGLPTYPSQLAFPEPCEPVRQLPDEVLPEEEKPEEPPPPPLPPIVEPRAAAGHPAPAPDSDPATEAVPTAPVSDPAPGAQPTEPLPPAGSSLADYLIYDELVVFFQPARDTTETVWDWRIVRVDEEGDTARVRGGVWVPGDSLLTSTDRAPQGAPAAFMSDLGWIWHEEGPGPGTYLLQSCLPAPVGGVFGGTMNYAGCRRPWVDPDTGEEERYPWQDEGSFEVGATHLVLKDFFAENGVITFGGEGGPWLALENVRRGAGGGADVVYTRDECVNDELPEEERVPPCARHGEGWRTVRHVERTAFSLELPPALDLQAPVMGELTASLTPRGEISAPSVIMVDDLIPAHEPSREMVDSRTTDATALVHPPLPEGERLDPADRPFVSADGRVNRFGFHNEYRMEPGEPRRTMGAWVRDPGVHWFLPMQLRMRHRDVYLYAVYGTRAGPYAGPRPRAPNAVDAVPEPDASTVEAAEGGEPRGGEPGAGVPGAGDPGTEVEGQTGAGLPEGPIDPAALDPDSPEVAGLIREWIRVASPPDAWPEDPDYRYDEWGRAVGRRVIGVIQPQALPSPRAATPEAHVWNLRDRLDSVDHCTLGEYVVRNLEGRGIEDCWGRYQPPPRAPDYTGQPVGPVRRELEGAGYHVEVTIGDRPDDPEQANTILRQRPEPGQRFRPGHGVTLTIYGHFHEPEAAEHRVVGVYGLTYDDARAMLADSGFAVPPPVGGDPAPTEEMAFRVSSQSVAGGELRPPGTEIRLTLYGPYRPNPLAGRDDPPPPPPVAQGPSCNDLVLAANRAQGRGDLSASYELYRRAVSQGCRNPGLRDAMESVYQSPQCTGFIRAARAAYDRNDFRTAIRSLRSAERAECDMSGLGPLVDGTLEGLETGVAQAMGRNCGTIAGEIAAARRRGDEATAQTLTTTALIQGCSGDEISAAAMTPLGPGGGGGPPAAGPPTAGGGEGQCYTLAGATVFGQDPPADAVMLIYEERSGDRVMYHVVEQYNDADPSRYSQFGGQMRRLDWQGSYQQAVSRVQELCGGMGRDHQQLQYRDDPALRRRR